MSRLVWPAVILLVLGCEPEPDVEPEVCRNARAGVAAVGSGDLKTGFVPLEDGDEATIVLGPQGLHMIIVSVRLEGFEMPSVGGQPVGVSVAIRYGGFVVGGVGGDLPPSTVDEQATEFLGLRAVLTTAEVEPLIGKQADLAVSVRDGCGRDIRASRTVTLTF